LSNIVPIPQAHLRYNLAVPHALKLEQTCFCFKPQNRGKVTYVSQKVMQLPLYCWGVYPGGHRPWNGTSHYPVGESTWWCGLEVLFSWLLPGVRMSPPLKLGQVFLSTELHAWCQYPRGPKAEPDVSSKIPKPQDCCVTPLSLR
jgi:hypothetical protein